MHLKAICQQIPGDTASHITNTNNTYFCHSASSLGFVAAQSCCLSFITNENPATSNIKSKHRQIWQNN